MQRTIVVGDIHGCPDELADLLQAVGHAKGDRLVLAGDLVAKGPDSQAVLQVARELGALAVLGNHDDHALRTHSRAVRDHRMPNRPDQQKMLDTLTPADWEYLEELPLFLRLGPEREGDPDTVVVHAGMVPGVVYEKQNRDHLLTLRSFTPEGAPSKRAEGTPWAARWPGPERVIFGHDAVRGLQQYPLTLGLDTGCVYGGRLTAVILPERRLVSVPARRAYVRW